jgi:hypothetical protein
MEKVGDRDPWAAFLLSLAVPGAGQLWAGFGSCAVWFALTAGLASLPTLLARAGVFVPGWSSGPALAALGLLSAEDARRRLAPRWRQRASGITTRLSPIRWRRSSVALDLEMVVPRPRPEVWALVADFSRFVCIDPFHARVIVLGPELRPGAALALEHRAFGRTFLRFGQLLSWREGQGYAFSDLSARGKARGFPHVFSILVGPADARPLNSTRLAIKVRGRWTARWVPRWAAGRWLRGVAAEHARLLQVALSGGSSGK